MRLCFLFLMVPLFLMATDKIRVAMFLDKGAHPRNNLVRALENAPDMTFTTLDGEELRAGFLKDFDLLLVPGGSAKVESIRMKAEGREEVRRFVERGGLYIGICAGCYLLTDSKPSDLGLLPVRTVDPRHWARGKGTLPIELTPMGQEVFGTQEKHIHVLYHNGPVIHPSGAITPLGFFRGELVARGGIHGLMNGAPAMFMGRYGKGWVLGISPHPEANPNQVFMELNAIRWLYTHRDGEIEGVAHGKKT